MVALLGRALCPTASINNIPLGYMNSKMGGTNLQRKLRNLNRSLWYTYVIRVGQVAQSV